MICASCDFAILPGEKRRRADKFSDSGAGVSLDLHELCPRTADEARDRVLTYERRDLDSP